MSEQSTIPTGPIEKPAAPATIRQRGYLDRLINDVVELRDTLAQIKAHVERDMTDLANHVVPNTHMGSGQSVLRLAGEVLTLRARVETRAHSHRAYDLTQEQVLYAIQLAGNSTNYMERLDGPITDWLYENKLD